jgi:hypothetical protein
MTEALDPNSPMCSPAACLRAEAEDLRERAAEADRLRAKYQTYAIERGEGAEAMRLLADRYEAAAAKLDEAE